MEDVKHAEYGAEQENDGYQSEIRRFSQIQLDASHLQSTTIQRKPE